MSKLGDRIRNLRDSEDIQQVDFAKKIGVSNVVLSRYESGERRPDYDTLLRIADFFDVTTDYLLGKTDKPKEASKTDGISVKGEKDVAKRLEEFKKDLTSSDGMNFSGEPMSDEAKESLIDAMEHIFRQTQLINKKFIPKKHRKDDN